MRCDVCGQSDFELELERSRADEAERQLKELQDVIDFIYEHMEQDERARPTTDSIKAEWLLMSVVSDPCPSGCSFCNGDPSKHWDQAQQKLKELEGG